MLFNSVCRKFSSSVANFVGVSVSQSPASSILIVSRLDISTLTVFVLNVGGKIQFDERIVHPRGTSNIEILLIDLVSAPLNLVSGHVYVTTFFWESEYNHFFVT